MSNVTPRRAAYRVISPEVAGTRALNRRYPSGSPAVDLVGTWAIAVSFRVERLTLVVFIATRRLARAKPW
jgi:hypothetical protein